MRPEPRRFRHFAPTLMVALRPLFHLLMVLAHPLRHPFPMRRPRTVLRVAMIFPVVPDVLAVIADVLAPVSDILDAVP